METAMWCNVLVVSLLLLYGQLEIEVYAQNGEACDPIRRPMVVNSSAGRISSPNYPLDYKNDLDCQWLIVSPTQQGQISITFSDLDTESCCDLVYVYDGNSTSARLLATLYQKPAGNYSSSGRYMLLMFTSDSSVVKRGFRASYWTTEGPSPLSACQENLRPLRLTDATKLITSPYYPLNYDDNLYCQWLIESSTASVVTITFIDVDTEPCCDQVLLYDGRDSSTSPVLATLQGSLSTSTYTTTQRYLLVQFTSDSSETRRGFQARLGPLSSCGQQPFDFNNASGVITSPNYPLDYDNNLDCQWLITAPFHLVVTIVFSDFQTEECCDSVYLYNGMTTSSSLIASLFRMPTRTYSSSQRYLLVRFTSDVSITSRGFSAFYSMGDPSSSTIWQIPLLSSLVALFGIATVGLVIGVCAVKKRWHRACQAQSRPTPPGPTAATQPHISYLPQTISTIELINQSESQADISTCVICMDRPQNAVFLPCRHGTFCIQCAFRQLNTSPVCPTCRNRIESILHVYR